ncbi:hypothetical protein P389DRAFT_77330 [Cystobasidium minutum MCA 4210]|uniref:uncharacterized protein n=1 Tax=Cystobasidium minutum MCA 4210 TaxID=1397322 RepID=UPI0034CF4888|eukprot:jgi/Rhomi1/77330/CE77329_369
MSDNELKGWNEWIAQAGDAEKKRKQSLWSKMIGRFSRRKRGDYKATDVDDNDNDIEGDADGKLPSCLRTNLNAEQAKRALIFPPMHRLPPNLTVTDLKYNRSKKAPLVSLNVILSTAIDAVLGAEGSTYAVSLIRVEAFRDLIQIIGSVTDFAKPKVVASSTAAAAAAISSMSSNTTISDSLNPLVNATIPPFDRTSPGYVILTVVPSVLGLDFVSAFGKAILWLWVFTLLCFIGCWEFRVMAREVGSTGTRKGGRVGHIAQAGHFSEGLDCEDAYNASRAASGRTKVEKDSKKKRLGPGGIPGWNWFSRLRRSRGYRITVIFLVTSLYLPLSKISIGALAWTSDF